MERFVLTDAQWAKMEPHCLGKPTDAGRSGSDNRRFVEAVLWIVRTGSPWVSAVAIPPSSEVDDGRLSRRLVGEATGIGKTAVGEYVRRAAVAGLELADP